MAAMADSEERTQIKRRFSDFLERVYPTAEDPNWSYLRALSSLYTTEDGKGGGKPVALVSRRLVVAEHHLREFSEELLARVLQHPAECLPAFEDALKELIAKDTSQEGLVKLLGDHTHVHIGLKGDFGRHEVSPRQLTSALLGKLVCVFGIVTKCSVVRPKVGWMGPWG